MDAVEVRQLLLQFLDEHAFNPVLTAPVDRADRREPFEDAQLRSERLRRRYHERCRTPEDIRRQFILDVYDTSSKLDRELDRLGLPTLPALQVAFLALCDALGVGAEEQPAAW